ncbi:MAG: hypothetical protein HEP71_04990 [Roseivirga sp.]|nr:hypothetical protein [Roseivirga sp.]
MQKLNAIFAIVILLLSMSPCADAWSDDDCQEHTHITQSTDGEHPEGDTCTPFCSCACCRVSVQQVDDISEPKDIVRNSHRPTNDLGRITNPPFKIWQPPRA